MNKSEKLFSETFPAKPERPKIREGISEQSREREDRIIHDLLERVGRLSIAAQDLEVRQKFPDDTKFLIQDICVALQTIIEERRDFFHPELHTEENMGGGQYRHRDEAIHHLESVIKRLEKRDMRTIDVKPESAGSEQTLEVHH